MSLLDDNTRKEVQGMLADIAGPVKMIVFTQEFECQYCRETRQIAEEIADQSEQVSVEIYDFLEDEEKAKGLGIDKIPAIALLADGDKDYGVRYYGIPSGYEFNSLLHDIKAVAAGPSATELSNKTLEYLEKLESDLHLQVFVTPT